MTPQFDVVVVGLGPAGMAAASTAARAGLSVTVVDDNPAPGGQVYRQGLAGLTGPGTRRRQGKRLIDDFEQYRSRIKVFEDAVVWAAFPPRTINIHQNETLTEIGFQRLIVCEGAQERVIPFPGWNLPGVMTAGGLQKMILHQRILPGRRIVLSGAGPLLLATAAAAVRAGAEVAAVCDSNPKSAYLPLLAQLAMKPGLLAEGFYYLRDIVKNRIPLLHSHAVVAAEGDDKVRRVTVAKLNADGSPQSHGRQEIEADVVALNHGFLPGSRLTRLLELAHVFDPVQRAVRPVVDRWGRTSRQDVFAAGDGAGVGGADYARLAGQAAGLTAALDLDRITLTEFNARTRPLLCRMVGYARYGDRLHALTAPRPGLYDALTDETIICRCEGLTLGRIKEFKAKTGGSLTELKPSRVGMGSCQGRICEPILIELLTHWGGRPDDIGQFHLRPPITPMRLGVFEQEARNNYYKESKKD